MPSIPPALTMMVDDRRLLGEIGHLFGSISDALAEVVQNAYRARATRLDVTVTGRTIVLADDGPGLADPELLFTVARSGWGEAVATDPAGMGAFALFALAEHVEVTSVPASGTAWRATFGQEAFAGAPIAIETPPPPSARPGLTIQVRVKPDVRLPDLLKSAWRHRYPLEVAVAAEGADPVVVPPVAGWAEAVTIPTAVGAISLCARVARDDGTWEARRSRAEWEHRIVSFPDDPIQRIKDHLPKTVAGALVRAHLQERVLAWSIDPSSTGARPKLPDRTHLIDDAALDDALQVIAAALVQQVDVDEVLRLAAGAVADRDILPDDALGSTQASGALGALGTSFGLSVVMPFLGYGQAWRATHPESWRVHLTVSFDEAADEWTELTEAVWVRPRYRVESDAVEVIALAEGIPAVVPSGEFPGADALPLVRLDASSLVASTAIGQIFAADLHLVSGGVRLAPVTHVYTREMSGEGADEALPPRWAAALKGLKPGPALADRWVPWSFWLGLHPLPEGMRAIEYVLRSPAFMRQALRESAVHEWPAWFWDYADTHRSYVDRDRLVRDLADLFAQEIGPETAAEVKRESRAHALSGRFANLEPKIRRALSRCGAAAGEAAGLNPELLAEIAEAGTRLCALLTAATPARLLADPAAKS